jgi:hypothetical protein
VADEALATLVTPQAKALDLQEAGLFF